MASKYTVKGYIYVSYRAPDGKWKCKATGYKESNAGDRQAAKRLVNELTRRERATRTSHRETNWTWVDEWMSLSWGDTDERTPSQYRLYWRTLQRWLSETGLKGPAHVRRENCLSYPKWRTKTGVSQNTAILELKFLGQILQEALRRGYVERNEARSLGIKRADPEKSKRAWTDEELEQVDAELERRDKFGWMRATFLMGRWQAVRLRQAQVPLSSIDFKRHPPVIDYPSSIVKGRGKGFSQPVDTRLVQKLKELVAHRRAIGAKTLCDVPALPSVEWRRFLDSIGIRGVSHHDLRRTWITKAALAGVSEAVACRYSNHGAAEVHRMYLALTTADMASQLEKLL